MNNFYARIKRKLNLDLYARVNEHYRGTYFTQQSLEDEIPVGKAGDEAYVDGGVGKIPLKYIWDTSDLKWQIGGGVPLIVDNSVSNGNANAVSSGAVYSAIAAIKSYKTVFINGDAVGANDGTTYENGFTTLQAAFLNATEFTIFKIIGSINPYTVTDTITCNLSYIKVIGVYEQSISTIPTIKILTSKCVIQFTGSNIEFRGVDFIGDANIANLTSDIILKFVGTTTQQNLTIRDLNFKSISSAYIGNLMKITNYDNVIVRNIKFSDLTVVSSCIRTLNCINLNIKDISFFKCVTTGAASGLIMIYATIGIISNVFIYKCNYGSTGNGTIYYQYLVSGAKSGAINDMVLDKWVVLNSNINLGFYVYGGSVSAQSKLTISNSIIKDCFGAAGSAAFSTRYAADTCKLDVINTTSINPMLLRTIHTYATTASASIINFIGCIFQDPTLFDVSKVNSNVTFNACYLPQVSTDDATVINCIIGSTPKLASINDYKIKSSSLCVDALDFELIKPYLKYSEQNHDIYGNLIQKPLLNIGAVQEVVYAMDLP